MRDHGAFSLPPDPSQRFFSYPKEPNFFPTDIIYNNPLTMEDYLNLFSEVGKKYVAIGEGTVWNLYSSVALKEIHSFNKDARIIAILRNPIDLIHSLLKTFHK